MSGPNAEILTIGTELLLGQIIDTNTAEIARALRDHGIDLYRTSTVGDNRQRIATELRRALQNSQLVITTGGLGPTVDDVTRQAIADVLQVELQFRPELWEQIKERFARFGHTPGENNRRQAHVPSGATPIENPVGTAPAFFVEQNETLIIALPGVPAEMSHLLDQRILPFLRERFDLHGAIHTRVLRVVGMGESDLDAKIEDLEQANNPTVGVSAHPGRVDIRLAAKAQRKESARRMLDELESQLRSRLGDMIYGLDDETLESAVLRRLETRGLSLVSVEGGSGGALAAALAPYGDPFREGSTLPDPLDEASANRRLRELMRTNRAQVGLWLTLQERGEGIHIQSGLHSPSGRKVRARDYGGPPATAPDWAVSFALDFVRREFK